MKIIKQLGIIFCICLAGEGISILLPFPCPGGIASMILLFLLLLFRVVKEEDIRECADFFLDNMAFFYIPMAVGMLEYLDILKRNIVVILLICFVSFLVTLIVTYYTVVFVDRLMGGGKKK